MEFFLFLNNAIAKYSCMQLQKIHESKCKNCLNNAIAKYFNNATPKQTLFTKLGEMLHSHI